MGLFKQFKLAKKNPSPLVAIYGTINCGNTFLKGQRKQQPSMHSFLLKTRVEWATVL